jgi:hypothetical protein
MLAILIEIELCVKINSVLMRLIIYTFLLSKAKSGSLLKSLLPGARLARHLNNILDHFKLDNSRFLSGMTDNAF